jgi:adenylate cyclase
VGALKGEDPAAARPRPAGERSPAVSILAALAIAGLVLLLARSLAGPLLHGAEERAGDLAWRVVAARGEALGDERRVLVVDIDERSLREIGPWPWPRETVARLLDALGAAGVRLQVLDIVFPERREGDDALAAAIAHHRPVLAQVFALEQGGEASAGRAAGRLPWSSCPPPFGSAQGLLGNAPGLLAPDTAAGHITPRIAADGVLRQQPAVVCFDGGAYPALALAALMQASGETALALERGDPWLGPPWRLVAPRLPGGAVPLDERGDLRLPWARQPQRFIAIPAADVLAGRAPAAVMGGAWVLVGSSAFGLNDTIATPFGGAAAGLLAHAQLLTALVDARVPTEPRAAGLLQALLALAGAALLALGVRRFGGAPQFIAGLPLAALGLAAGLFALHVALLAGAALWLGWVQPALFIVAFAAACAVLEHLRSRRDRDRLYAHLASYLPAPVAASLALQPPSDAIRAATMQVSVLVADIRNFSAYCEARPPEETAAVLHAFFSAAARIVEEEGGEVEAFQGDAVVAVWNATVARPQADHARRALRAAGRLHDAAQALLPDPAPPGLEPLALGIGLESGPAMVGSFGLARRRTHMVMGRTVTIASRLAEMTADLSHPILVGEGMAGQLAGQVDGQADGGGRAGPIESLGTFLLDGLRMPHHVYASPVAGVPRLPQ